MSLYVQIQCFGRWCNKVSNVGLESCKLPRRRWAQNQAMISRHLEKNAYASTFWCFQRRFRVGEEVLCRALWRTVTSVKPHIETNVLGSRPSFRNPLETAEAPLRKYWGAHSWVLVSFSLRKWFSEETKGTALSNDSALALAVRPLVQQKFLICSVFETTPWFSVTHV